jgi:hypothetical protein
MSNLRKRNFRNIFPPSVPLRPDGQNDALRIGSGQRIRSHFSEFKVIHKSFGACILPLFDPGRTFDQ